MKKKYYIISGVACLCTLSLFCAYSYLNSVGHLMNKATDYCNSLESGDITCLCEIKTCEIFFDKKTLKEYLTHILNKDVTNVKKTKLNWYKNNQEFADLYVIEKKECGNRELYKAINAALEKEKNGK